MHVTGEERGGEGLLNGVARQFCRWGRGRGRARPAQHSKAEPSSEPSCWLLVRCALFTECTPAAARQPAAAPSRKVVIFHPEFWACISAVLSSRSSRSSRSSSSSSSTRRRHSRLHFRRTRISSVRFVPISSSGCDVGGNAGTRWQFVFEHLSQQAAAGGWLTLGAGASRGGQAAGVHS